jgi:hypothetical protein
MKEPCDMTRQEATFVAFVVGLAIGILFAWAVAATLWATARP